VLRENRTIEIPSDANRLMVQVNAEWDVSGFADVFRQSIQFAAQDGGDVQ
jgi:hypothetical protein